MSEAIPDASVTAPQADLPSLPKKPTEESLKTGKVEKKTEKKPHKDEKRRDTPEPEKRKEAKKSGLTNEEIIQRATQLALPNESALYHTEVAIQKNVLLVGKGTTDARLK